MSNVAQKVIDDANRKIRAVEHELKEYRRLQRGCPSCISGKPARAMLDEDGVLTSVSGKPGQWGHGYDDFHWYCADAGAIAENGKLRAALGKIYAKALELGDTDYQDIAADAGVKPLRMEELECPCCGDVGAESDGDGLFHDGQPLVCGCPGWVSVGENSAYINNGDDPCKRCDPAVE